MNYQSRRYIIIIKYWLKVISSEENKYIKQIYNSMLNDLKFATIKTKLGITC